MAQKTLPFVDENDQQEENRHERLTAAIGLESRRDLALGILYPLIPVFVLFSKYFRVRPNIHLEHLAQRLESGVLDDKTYDYGNECLLRLLGFTARDLSNLGKAAEPPNGDAAAFQRYRDQLDTRTYQLNAACVRLTEAINRVWVPDKKRDEANRLRVLADGQYLKVVVEDELGVEIELDQRSEGYQWLVSFFVVFFAESAGKHKNNMERDGEIYVAAGNWNFLGNDLGMVPGARIELATPAFSGRRSTTELPRHM